MRALKSFFGAAIVVLALTGCSAADPAGDTSPAQLKELRGAIADGDDCTALFAVFDQIDEDGEAFPDAQGELINVGCHTRGSQRTDADLAAQAPGSPWLGVPGEEVSPSEVCKATAQAAAAEKDSTRAEPLIAATLDDCVSVDEWMSVLALHPGVMGMAPGYIPQLLDLQTVCYTYTDSAVCQDALGRGLKVGP